MTTIQVPLVLLSTCCLDRTPSARAPHRLCSANAPFQFPSRTTDSWRDSRLRAMHEAARIQLSTGRGHAALSGAEKAHPAHALGALRLANCLSQWRITILTRISSGRTCSRHLQPSRRQVWSTQPFKPRGPGSLGGFR